MIYAKICGRKISLLVPLRSAIATVLRLVLRLVARLVVRSILTYTVVQDLSCDPPWRVTSDRMIGCDNSKPVMWLVGRQYSRVPSSKIKCSDLYFLQYFSRDLKLSGWCIRHDVMLTFKMKWLNQPTYIYTSKIGLWKSQLVAASVVWSHNRSC